MKSKLSVLLAGVTKFINSAALVRNVGIEQQTYSQWPNLPYEVGGGFKGQLNGLYYQIKTLKALYNRNRKN